MGPPVIRDNLRPGYECDNKSDLWTEDQGRRSDYPRRISLLSERDKPFMASLSSPAVVIVLCHQMGWMEERRKM